MPKRDQEELLEQLKTAFKANVPSGSIIAMQAIEAAIKGKDPRWVKRHFSGLVQSIQSDAYNRYLAYEKKGWEKAFRSVFGPTLKDCSSPEQVADLMIENFYAFDKFFLSLTQGRRHRAGRAFEVLIREFFSLLKYPADPQPQIDGNPDFILPSLAYYDEDPLNVIIFTVKRSLRERWRQIVTEGKKGRGFFLGTIDEAVSEKDLSAMQKEKIFLVVPEALKTKIPHYKKSRHVISFEEFFLEHVDPAMAIWSRRSKPRTRKHTR